MNRIEAAWQRLLDMFDADPVDCYLSADTEHQLAMLRVHDHQSAVSIASLLDEVECDGVLYGSDTHPCVRNEPECEFLAG